MVWAHLQLRLRADFLGGPGGPAIVSAAPELPTVAEDAEADAQSISWADEETSDKQRRIAKTLQAGDVVEEVGPNILSFH
jgi:hypothetical protein